MNDPALAGPELLAWNHATAQRWLALLSDHPEFLATPCDIYRSGTVGHFLQHIVAAELRYAERLTEAAPTDYAAIPYTTAEEIFHTHDRAHAILNALLADPTFQWDRELEFTTLTAGRLAAPSRIIFQHALLHGIRHYAQLATIARQHGLAPGPMDYLLTAARRVEEPHA
jgi:uncharacterized damage-inducible protein DinB